MNDVTSSSRATSPPRASATVVLLRDAGTGLETLLLRRAERGDRNSGAWVFPGGLVDAADRAAHACCAGLDDAAASARLGLAEGGLDFYVAALRECFEESGLLLAHGLAFGAAERLQVWRGPLYRGEASLAELCRAEGARLAADRLHYFGHWLTPPGLPKRFDTRFFLAEAPAGQTAAHDLDENAEHRWMRPADALAAEPPLKLLTPTQKTLEWLRGFDQVADVLAWAREPREVALTMPRIGIGADGRQRPVAPDEPAWAEIGRLDPEGRGDVSHVLRPGVAVRLSPRVIRVTANNGSLMTGPGTNSYLVGGGARNEWAVIDPGPADPAHVQAVLAAAPGQIRWVFATHTHLDHSPATAALVEATGARVLGRIADHPEWQDAAFVPDEPLAGGERLDLDGATLRAIHTPGHASNHLCYLLEEERTLFTGDHVMQLSTVVINPPDGDMAAYLASLRELAARDDIDWLAPGHGFLIAEPKRVFEGLVAHRLKREAKVLAALRGLGRADLEALLVKVYDDVPAKLHPMARRSLTAHLLKLWEDGTASLKDGRWSLIGAAP